MDQFLLGFIEGFIIRDSPVPVNINRDDIQAFQRPVRLGIIGVCQIVEAYRPLVFLYGLGNSGISEHRRACQVLLLGPEPGGKGLGGPAGIGSGVNIDLVLLPVSEELAPGADFPRNPYLSGFLGGEAPRPQYVRIGIPAVEIRNHGIPTDNEGQGSGLNFLLVEIPGEHRIVDHSVQDIGHSLAGTAGRNVNLHRWMQCLEFIGPLHGKRI